jgi:anaerobic sulfite reductase subunit C
MPRTRHDPPDTHAITPCRGVCGDCPNTLLHDPSLVQEIETIVLRSGWPEFLTEHLSGPIRPHHQFRIAVAACANGCSQPHIMDFALIRASAPRSPLECEACGACVEACPDRALAMPGKGAPPLLDSSRCLNCGRCVRACPSKVMGVKQEGFRILVGGKLGRRPKLAAELSGLYQREKVLLVLEALLKGWMAAWRPGLRLGDVVEEVIQELPLAETHLKEKGTPPNPPTYRPEDLPSRRLAR